MSYTSIDELVDAYSADISQGGMFVVTDELLPIGEVVKVTVTLPDDGPSFAVFARVAHTIGPEGRAGGRAEGMGLEFLDVGDTPLADEIARYLAAAECDAVLPPAPAGVSATVLVVDDDETQRDAIAQVVRDAGHHTVTAKNGMDALRKALADPPDLIVTDVYMPALDGWQFVRLARARPELANVPVMFVTGGISDEERLKGYQLGVCDFVTKSFVEEELGLRVQRVLERRRAFPGSAGSSSLLSGDISHVSVGRVLTLLAAEEREGVLRLVRRDEIASAYFRGGAVVRVDVPEAESAKSGEQRLYYLLDWREGRFEFSLCDVADENTVGLSVPEALLRHATMIPEGDPTDS